MKERNPNRDLGPDEIEKLVAERLPHLAAGLGRDRLWSWLATPKPSEEDRKVLIELGFGFTGKPHAMPDGGFAHWYHASGGPVLRRGRNGKANHRRQAASTPANRMVEVPEISNSEAYENLARLAEAFA